MRREFPQYFLWDNKNDKPVPVSMLRWAAWFEDIDNRRVAYDQLGTGTQRVTISTVCLGLDHNFARWTNPDLPPILFETMVFGGKSIGMDLPTTIRYATKKQALAGHRRCVKLVAAAIVAHRAANPAPRLRNRRRKQ